MSDAPQEVCSPGGEADEPPGTPAGEAATANETPAVPADDDGSAEEDARDAADAAEESPSTLHAEAEQSYGDLMLTRSEEELRVRMQSGEIYHEDSYAQAHRSYGMPSSVIAPRGRERRENGVSVSYRRFPALAQLSDLELASVTITQTQQHALGMGSSASLAHLGHGCAHPPCQRCSPKREVRARRHCQPLRVRLTPRLATSCASKLRT
jgi:hypothetical protein